MAVDPHLVEKDMYLGTVGDLDERIVKDGWTYYIHATKRPRQLGRPPYTSGSLVGDLLVGVPLELFLDLRARGRPWTIGVVRLGYVGSWNDQAPKVVHRETLEPGEDPRALIAQLAADIDASRFDPPSA